MLSFKANLHLHSSFSDGGNPPEEVMDTAASLGFDYIGFTDHYSPTPSLWLYPGCYLMTEDLEVYINCLLELRTKYKDRRGK